MKLSEALEAASQFKVIRDHDGYCNLHCHDEKIFLMDANEIMLAKHLKKVFKVLSANIYCDPVDKIKKIEIIPSKKEERFIRDISIFQLVLNDNSFGSGSV